MPRGFAALTPEQRAAISSKGGKAAQAAGTGHRWDSWSARVAGYKGALMRRVLKARTSRSEGNA